MHLHSCAGMMAMLPVSDQGQLCRPMTAHGTISAHSRVTSVQLCGGRACSRAAALVNKHQHLTRRGASQLPSGSIWSRRSRKGVACQAEQQEQERIDLELVPQRDPATTTRPLQVQAQMSISIGQLMLFGRTYHRN